MVHGNLRLTTPLKRTGTRGSGRFVAITWNEALNEVYEGFSRAIDRFGPQSVMPFNYAGPHGELAGGSMDRRFFHKLGATLLNRAPLCGAVRGTAYSSLFGAAPGMPPEQAIHSDLIVIWGNNVTVSNLAPCASHQSSARKRCESGDHRSETNKNCRAEHSAPASSARHGCHPRHGSGG